MNKFLNIIKQDYTLKKDPLSNPIKSKSFSKKQQDIFLIREKQKDYINFYNKKNIKKQKKNGIVLMHLLTDCPRKRCEGIWLNNYLEWLNLTIKTCAINKEMNWFFKAHPFDPIYPIRENINKDIKKRIINNGFSYIKSEENLLHNEISKIASVIVTCHGTCKMEYPALYGIPVISCFGYKELAYDASTQPFTAKNETEYKNLILNAQNLSLTEREIRKARELLVFNKFISGRNIKNDFKIYKHKDKNGKEVIRNF